MEGNLEELYKILNIEFIPKERNYWLIRTSSGKYFDDFLFNNYVSIAWDEFSNKNDFKNIDEKKLKEQITEKYPNEKRPGYIYNQIKKFMFEIKKDDMILIPSENSFQVAFGIVTEEFYIRDTSNIKDTSNFSKCKFKKCIKVEWKKTIFKENFDPYLRMLMFSHITVADVNDYKEHINRILYSNYVLGDSIHSIFNVTAKDNINATALVNFLHLVTSKSIDKFNEITNSNIPKDTIEIKLSVQSPGPIEFIGYSVGAILCVCAFNTLFFGSKFDLELFNVIKFNIDTPGIIGSILKFIQEKNNNNFNCTKLQNDFELSKKELEIKQSENLLNIIPNTNKSEKTEASHNIIEDTSDMES